MYIFDEKVYGYELCHVGTIKPSYLMRYMQTAAGLDCDAMGASYHFLREHGLVFVLTKLKLEMLKDVKAGQDITIKTWQKEIRGVTFIRDFEFTCQGEVIGYASTQWAFMNFETRRPARVTDSPIDFPNETDIPSRPIELERRIIIPEGATEYGTFKRKVYLSDLDENLHLNNTNYADIMLDFIPPILQNSSFNNIQILFRGEARLDDQLEVKVYYQDNCVYYCAENLTKNHTCFEGKLVLN